MPTTHETKLCCSCGRRTPLNGFPWRKQAAGARHSQCRFCYVEYHRNYRCRRRAKRIDGYVSQLARAPTSDRMIAICNAMVDRFGGLNELSLEWKQQIISRPGTAASLRSFATIARMIKACSNSTRPSVKQLSDDDLAGELTVAVARLIQDRPEMAVEALQRLGWQVVSPNQRR